MQRAQNDTLYLLFRNACVHRHYIINHHYDFRPRVNKKYSLRPNEPSRITQTNANAVSLAHEFDRRQ